jgi:nicotinate-nucleotide--dimethylbenzimidazole phosphoribosyltransferase
MVDVIRVGREIRRADVASDSAVREHLGQLTKPVGSLGRLEDVARRLALIYGDPPPTLARRCVLTFAADHGVAAERVSAYGAEVTGQMCRVAGAGRAAINVMAGACAAAVFVVDVGVNAAEPLPGVEHRRVRNGTRNLAVEPAIDGADVARALAVGYDAVVTRLDDYDVFAVGELGIGNSTSAAAVTAALLGVEPHSVCGRGTGIDDQAFERKLRIVADALRRMPHTPTVAQVLGMVGGLELCAITGATVACARHRRAVVTDGFIATAGVLAGVCANRAIADYVFASHMSTEPGHALQLAHIGVAPLFELGMRLGEGTGAVLALPILDAAARLLREMATFGDAGVSQRSGGVGPL